NSQKGVLKFARGNVAYVSFELPPDWNPTASVDLRISFTTSDTVLGDTTLWKVQTACNATDGTANDDAGFSLSPVLLVSQSIGLGAVLGGQYVATRTGLLTGSSCQPGYNFIIKITRDNNGGDTNPDLAVAAKWLELSFGRVISQ